MLYNVINEDSAPKLWTKLESLYMTKSLTNQLYLKEQLYSTHEGTSVMEHLNMFILIICELASIDVQKED